MNDEDEEAREDFLMACFVVAVLSLGMLFLGDIL